MTEAIDWRALLVKYIDHVGQCEGTDFISRIDDRAYGGSEVVFTAEELSALRTCAAETE